jgi:type VI secretion system ImpM family protein
MSALTVAFYGKLNSAPDFVRINAGAFQQAGWDAWFQEGMVELQRLGLRLPSLPVSFVLSSQERICAGTFAPGQDALGRSFPAIVSIETPAPLHADLASWRQQYELFFAAAGSLASQASQLTFSQLAARMLAVESRLEVISPQAPWSETMAGASLAELSPREDLTDIAYGLTTAITACRETRPARPGLPARVLTLCGPASTEIQRGFWIELVCRHLDQTLPCVFWTEQNLVLALGAPPPAVLACLLDPGRGGSRFWPLRTSSAGARAVAVAKLSPAQAHVLASPGTSLAHVLSVFSRISQ